MSLYGARAVDLLISMERLSRPDSREPGAAMSPASRPADPAFHKRRNPSDPPTSSASEYALLSPDRVSFRRCGG